MSYQRPNNRGVPVGKMAAGRGGKLVLEGSKRLFPGDVVEFWTRRGHEALTLSEGHFDDNGALRPFAPSALSGVAVGDRVFRVRSASAAFDDDRLAAARAHRLCGVHCSWAAGLYSRATRQPRYSWPRGHPGASSRSFGIGRCL